MDFYEYACTKNGWVSDDDKITNLRLSLTNMAKSWFEMRVVDDVGETWEQWKQSFLSAFQENAVERWDRAIFHKYRYGSVLEYFYEKRKLLQLADHSLPETSVVPLVIHGLNRDLQKQVQVRGPTTITELLSCFKELTPDRPFGSTKTLGTTGDNLNNARTPTAPRQMTARSTWTPRSSAAPLNVADGTLCPVADGDLSHHHDVEKNE